MNSKYSKQWLLVFSVLFILLILAYFGNQRARSYSFNGVIENVSYNSKHIPTITIKGKEYDLDFIIGDYSNIKVGDTAIKKEGELSFILKRKKR